MEDAIVNVKENEQNKGHSFQCQSKGAPSTKDDRLSGKLAKNVNKKELLIFNLQKLQNCIPFPYRLHGFNNRIPRKIMGVDERYLLRCLELIHINASKAALWNVTSEMSSGRHTGRTAFDLPRFISDSPSAGGTENTVISMNGDWILGTITRSKSMVNILNSPIFRQLGHVDGNGNFERENMVDVRESRLSECMSSPHALSISSSQKLQREMLTFGDDGHVSEPMHKRLASVSGINSSSSDQSSFSMSAGFSQGMLQCRWKDGFPHHVFSVDDQREVYTARLMKVESPDSKVLDYTYMIYSRTSGIKEHEIDEYESDLVGKMKVATSFMLCPNNSKIMETQFVLFGSHENFVGDMQTSNHTPRKTRGFSKKMVDVFRISHSAKQRTSKFGGASSPLDSSLWESCQESCNNPDRAGISNLSADHPPPNLELAAIVVKDHVLGDCKEAEVGGWGLKFLKKARFVQTDASIETSVNSECAQRNTGDCCTSMDILIPAGFHGGPRTRNGGPATLIERWSSGGLCDCGGWDLGCPLTRLGTSLRGKDSSSLGGTPDACRTFDLIFQGSKQSTPVMKMVNIHDGLYYIHFQSTLSALQSFSIAAAIIHTHSPTLRPKVYCR